MHNLTTIQSETRERVLKYRRLERIVHSTSFEVAFSKGTLDPKLVEACACDELAEWVKRTLAESYGEYSVRQLRQLAIRLAIKNYSFMSKPELLSAIVEKESEQGKCYQGA